MRAIDVHQHLWPAAFIEALRERDGIPRLDGSMLVLPEGTYEVDLGDHLLGRRLSQLDAAEIDVAVVSLQPTMGLETLPADERGHLERVWEDGALELSSESGGRIVPLAASRPREGFAGVSVGADTFDDLDPLAPVLDALRGSGFLFVHPVAGRAVPGAPVWWPAVVDYTAQMQRAYFAWLAGGQSRWPDVNIVFAILAGGAPIQLERLASRGVDVRSVLYSNVFFDTSSYGRRALEVCVETFGVEQLVHGSDAPVIDPATTLRAIREFGESVERLVTLDNPNRLLT
ncbi:MAG: amidohydrolase [Thermoleophilia bacterium]|nr:amidohydrolase [Thermoleophilia bacterium]